MKNFQEKKQETKTEVSENNTSQGLPPIDFTPETYLNTEGMNRPQAPSPENKIEGLNISAQYREMIGEMFMEKVLRPNMTTEELDQLAAEMIAEYEAPMTEKTEQEDLAFMDNEAERNRTEMAPITEKEISPLSRATELISSYLSKYKKIAQAVMGMTLVSELAGCATGDGGYYTQQAVSAGLYGLEHQVQTEIYGRGRQQQTEAYGIQHANSQARYATQYAERRYRQNMMAEDFRYQRSVRRPLSPQQKQDIDLRHREHVENIKAQYDQEMISAQQRYNDNVEQTRMQSENIRRDTEIQRQNIQMDTQMQITNQIVQGFLRGIIKR